MLAKIAHARIVNGDKRNVFQVFFFLSDFLFQVLILTPHETQYVRFRPQTWSINSEEHQSEIKAQAHWQTMTLQVLIIKERCEKVA